jgi:hypothetical protein
MTRTRMRLMAIPLPTIIVVDAHEMTDEDPFWTWTSERMDEQQ